MNKPDYPKIPTLFFFFFFLGPPLPLANDRQLPTRSSRFSVSYF